ncbi:hypothetical protein B484DRAFT_361419 [Ochromonadaceae sp. CCMP2298]|nr:hypothetical protein B484DRAFT_361419 [Ochromonadaceae sp. CCMP2298]
MGVADELVVKKVKRMRPFTEDVLTLPDGLQRIHEEFPVSCRFRGRGSEANDVKKLMAMYREWAFQLHPGLSFGDVLSKCDALSGKPKTRACLQDLRDRERDRYIVEVLGVDKSAFEWKEPSPKRSAPAPATASDPFSTTATTATVTASASASASYAHQAMEFTELELAEAAEAAEAAMAAMEADGAEWITQATGRNMGTGGGGGGSAEMDGSGVGREGDSYPNEYEESYEESQEYGNDGGAGQYAGNGNGNDGNGNAGNAGEGEFAGDAGDAGDETGDGDEDEWDGGAPYPSEGVEGATPHARAPLSVPDSADSANSGDPLTSPEGR